MSIIQAFDRPIAFHPIYAKVAGSVNAGIMLSQALYWSNRTKDPNGWFFKTQAEWEEETSLTRYEQEGARKKLLALGVWEEDRRGVPAKLFYRVNVQLLENKIVEYQQASMRESITPDCGNPADCSGEIPQSINKETENTTENTTESAPLAIFDEVFPGKRTIFSTQAIENASISDEQVWRESVSKWKTNGYSMRNIAGLIDFYKQNMERSNGKSDWQRKREEFTRSTLEAFAAQEETRRKNRERYASEGDAVYITPPTLADKLAAERRRRDECAGVSVV